MRAVVQRVRRASVEVGGARRGSIGKGLLLFAGIEKGDGVMDIEYTASKVSGLRVFEDEEGKMNLGVLEAGGGILVVSQFTLLGDCRKGRRPSFDRAEAPERAAGLYRAFIALLREKGFYVEEGEFQAHMEIESVNDGPVTILLDSRKTF